MSSRRKFTTEFKVEVAHRVIDSGRSIAEVARELSVGEQLLGEWLRDERRRMDAARGTENEPLTPQEKAEFATLSKKVVELEKTCYLWEKYRLMRVIGVKWGCRRGWRGWSRRPVRGWCWRASSRWAVRVE
jgi:transposase